MSSQHDTVVRQFGPRAAAYVASAVHAAGADLDRITAVLAGLRPARVLDMGCGGGHASFAAAPVSGEVIAYDLSADMLAAVAAEAARRGNANIITRQGAAETLPFEDDSFDAVITRFSAHHWGDAAAGVREAGRVLRPGGTAIFADVVAMADPLLDTFLQSFEMLRDTSHVRDYTQREWVDMAGAAGLVAGEVTAGRLPIGFASWIARMQTPPVFEKAILALQQAVPERVRQHFEVAGDGSFVLDTLVLVARKPG